LRGIFNSLPFKRHQHFAFYQRIYAGIYAFMLSCAFMQAFMHLCFLAHLCILATPLCIWQEIKHFSNAFMHFINARMHLASIYAFKQRI